MSEYNHKDIEKKWQKEWERHRVHHTDPKEDQEDFYVLVEFPYPSGNLHVGHWYAFSVPDIFVRAKHMQGHNVLYPIGFDAFGLPAENAAIKRDLDPREWTYGNIDHMRGQLKTMGASFDWSREVVTCDPAYYRWTQWLFLQFLKKGLAYQDEGTVNWCPSCKTVLANEQVTNAGECERCDTEVEEKEMQEWKMKITDYADRLLDDLEELNWPESIKGSQRNWIGKSEGAVIPFTVSDMTVEVFTTRPDTLYGATYLVLAPEHEGIKKLKSHIANWDAVKSYFDKTQKKTEQERTKEEKEKTGVLLEGVSATNPATGKEIPVWVADYVLAHYGTGAVMAVPAHDERDWEFAKQHDLPIVPVIDSPEGDTPYTGEGSLKNSETFNGMDSTDAREAIVEHVGGEMKSTYRLRDWSVSRQRYWGCPIPVIHCDACGVVPVPEDDLPVVLPDIEDFMPRDDGKSPLAKKDEWVKTTCPECGGEAERETDTLDTFVDSSWYFLRYTDPHNETYFADRKKQDRWMPVDVYSGGAEHTTMHLLYSRFFHKALYDMDLVADKEPYTRRMNRGLILGPDGNKMSKSKGNVIDPDGVVEDLGADTVRMYLAFIGPYNEVGAYPWSTSGITGVRRFIERVWDRGLSTKTFSKEADIEVDILLHRLIKKVTNDVVQFKFNTAVAACMSFSNEIEKKDITKSQFETFLLLLAPFIPHVTEELWHTLGNTTSIHDENWPAFDPAVIAEQDVTIVVQVNGKKKGTFEASVGMSKEEVFARAQKEGIIGFHKESDVDNIIYVQDKLLNIVLTS